MKLSEKSIKNSFETLSQKHKLQVQALSQIADFLEIIATSELKCAELLNKIEEFEIEKIAQELSPGITSFLQSMQAGCASKAL